jgi:hypothetical protein
MTEPTTQALTELRKLAEAVRDAELPHPKWLAENAFKADLNYGTVIELLDAIEAQAREIERLKTDIENYVRISAEQGTELVAIRAQESMSPKGFALVPLRPTAAMQEVFNEEGWEWADVLAAAEVVTEDQYLYALKDGAESLQDEMLETAISWFDSNGINSLEVEQLISLVGSLYIAVRDTSPVADVNAGLVEALVAAVQANHDWHQQYDDQGGYPDSALEEQNIAALSTARTQQAQKGGE